jgi:hypothetical protein
MSAFFKLCARFSRMNLNSCTMPERPSKLFLMSAGFVQTKMRTAPES